jgi:hypothetical protein
VLSAVLIGLAPVAVGCGAGSKAPSVASVGSRSTPGTPSPAAAQTVSPQGSTADLDAYAACMSADGVPTKALAGGQLLVKQGPGVPDARSPQFRAAQKACQKLLPRGGLPRPGRDQIARRLAQSLEFAACMRAHGVPGFPDPNNGGGFDISPSTDGGIDPSSPQFKSSQKACQKDVPGVSIAPG